MRMNPARSRGNRHHGGCGIECQCAQSHINIVRQLVSVPGYVVVHRGQVGEANLRDVIATGESRRVAYTAEHS